LLAVANIRIDDYKKLKTKFFNNKSRHKDGLKLLNVLDLLID